MDEKKQSNLLQQIFPSKKIDLYDNKSLTVKPVPLDMLGSIISIISPLFNSDNAEMKETDLAQFVVKHALELLPLCVDIPLKQIPISVLPDVLDAIIEFNFPDESLKKWVSLIKRFQSMRGVIKDLQKQ